MNDWNYIKVAGKPSEKGIYIVASSYGVRCAHFDPTWPIRNPLFQDCATNNDEGIRTWDEDESRYEVYAWMECPEFDFSDLRG